MSARRTISHPQGGWSAIVVHLEAAESTQQGFYLTLFFEQRTPVVLFLRPHQLTELVELAAQTGATDQQVWDLVAKIPLEPLLPNRSLAGRLRALLSEQAGPIREQIAAQLTRPAPTVNEAEPPPSSPPESSNPPFKL